MNSTPEDADYDPDMPELVDERGTPWEWEQFDLEPVAGTHYHHNTGWRVVHSPSSVRRRVHIVMQDTCEQ